MTTETTTEEWVESWDGLFLQEATVEITDHGYWALLDTRVAGNRCRIYSTEAEATAALEATVEAARAHAERQVQHAVDDARNKLVVVAREWGEQPNAPLRHT
jgi:hypothetical protein